MLSIRHVRDGMPWDWRISPKSAKLDERIGRKVSTPVNMVPGMHVWAGDCCMAQGSSGTSAATSRLRNLAGHLSAAPAATSARFSTMPTRCPITSHVLDTTLGKPARGVPIHLEQKRNGSWVTLGSGVTNADGRVETLLALDHVLEAGVYRITFDTAAYYSALGGSTFYPEVSIVFDVASPRGQHYHVPLLLNPYGYSTYRGS